MFGVALSPELFETVIPDPAARRETYSPVVSAPKATELFITVAFRVALPKSVKVTDPLRSPPKVIVGDTPVITGLVKVLLVKVCVPVRVTTEAGRVVEPVVKTS